MNIIECYKSIDGSTDIETMHTCVSTNVVCIQTDSDPDKKANEISSEKLCANESEKNATRLIHALQLLVFRFTMCLRELEIRARPRKSLSRIYARSMRLCNWQLNYV